MIEQNSTKQDNRASGANSQHIVHAKIPDASLEPGEIIEDKLDLLSVSDDVLAGTKPQEVSAKMRQKISTAIKHLFDEVGGTAMEDFSKDKYQQVRPIHFEEGHMRMRICKEFREQNAKVCIALVRLNSHKNKVLNLCGRVCLVLGGTNRKELKTKINEHLDVFCTADEP